MTHIGFLACETTLPGSGRRREDAYEHDLTITALEPSLAARGMGLAVIDWEAPLDAFDGVDMVLLGTAWNYQDRAQSFLERLETLESRGITVCNPSDMVRWNMRKTYLRELAQRDVPTIPTHWLDCADASDIRLAMDEFGTERLVVKLQVGAGALDQQLLERGTLPHNWSVDRPVMLQPYLPSIEDEGELSFIFVGGEFSHVLRKLPASGDYRIQSLYGGRELTHTPSQAELEAALNVLHAIPFAPPLYARIDVLKGTDGGLKVMEVELIEPYLYPEQGPRLGEMLADAIAERVPAR
ncbi:MAG: hypothetical protein WA985_13245 [Erythrobacter sp.]